MYFMFSVIIICYCIDDPQRAVDKFKKYTCFTKKVNCIKNVIRGFEWSM